MGMTRRRFLGCTAGAVTTGLPLELWRAASPRGVFLLDLREHGCLGESVEGYESALAGLDARVLRVEAGRVPRCALLIVPAALELPSPAVRGIVRCLEAGASVILESGAAFTAGRDFRGQRDVLRDCLGIRIEAPVQLWSGDSRSRGVPYVDFTW